MTDNVIIMAGGAGKRLWPASTENRPKQFMTVDGTSSLFRSTLERAFALGIRGCVYVVTHQNHVAAAVRECADLPAQTAGRVRILAEPVARNTAPALALAAARMELDRRSQETCLVMAADHLISPPDAFASSVETASAEAQNGFIVPYGIVPSSPATGYGYIEAGSPAGGGLEVISFREKPDAETAESYAASGRHFWNAGLFTYRGDVFQSELALCCPEVSDIFRNPEESWFVKSQAEPVQIYEPSGQLKSLYERCPGISVDYAVMERTKKIRMVKAAFDWNDVGSWDVIADLNPPPESAVYQYESEGNFVSSDRPVALCGVKDLIVVSSGGRILICRKGQSQLVKNAAEEDFSKNFS